MARYSGGKRDFEERNSGYGMNMKRDRNLDMDSNNSYEMGPPSKRMPQQSRGGYGGGAPGRDSGMRGGSMRGGMGVQGRGGGYGEAPESYSRGYQQQPQETQMRGPPPQQQPPQQQGIEERPSHVLLFNVFNPKYPITVDVMNTICSAEGRIVNRILIFKKNGVQALVEFDSVDTAINAREALNGADIYSGCCTLKIDYAKPNRLQVVKNDTESWDYTNPNLGKEPPKPAPLLPDPKYGGSRGGPAMGGGPVMGEGPSMAGGPGMHGGPGNFDEYQDTAYGMGPGPRQGAGMPRGGAPQPMPRGGPGYGAPGRGGRGGAVGNGSYGYPHPDEYARPGQEDFEQYGAPMERYPPQPEYDEPVYGMHPMTPRGGMAQRGPRGGMPPGRGVGRGSPMTGRGGYIPGPEGMYAPDMGPQAGAPDQHQGCVLMVYGLPEKEVNCQKLFNLFCLYGNVIRIRFLKSKEGAAMVQMGDTGACERAINNLSGCSFFGSKMSLSFSKQAFIQEIPRPVDLEDGTSSYKDFTSTRNNRFTTPEAAAKNRIQAPSKSLYFFNAPSQIGPEDIKKVFADAGAKTPENVRIFESRNEKSCTGIAEFASKGDCIEALCLANHSSLRSQNPNLKPFIIKFCFTGPPSQE